MSPRNRRVAGEGGGDAPVGHGPAEFPRTAFDQGNDCPVRELQLSPVKKASRAIRRVGSGR